MKLSEFDYSLPKDLIAQYPADERDTSRLMVINRKTGEIQHKLFRNIIDYLKPGDVLVLNDAKVIPARLDGVKQSGGKVEILLLKEIRDNLWEALVKGLTAGKVKLSRGITASVSRSNGTARVKLEMEGRGTGGNDIKKTLHEIGMMPLPPYIKRPSGQSDSERYQTVYAKNDGAVAAPTAGLHFTGRLLKSIRDKNIDIRMITLYVGYGTFRPVEAENIEEHIMYEETYKIPAITADAVNRARAEGRRVIAVGTTVTRALEASTSERKGGRIRPIRNKTLQRLSNGVKAGAGSASIFIYPGYKFNAIDALITNFHLPRSTPLMLTSAFSGPELLLKAYQEAIQKAYRFYSYGDSMIII